MKNPLRKRWWVVFSTFRRTSWVGSSRLCGLPPMSSWFILFSVTGPFETEAEARTKQDAARPEKTP